MCPACQNLSTKSRIVQPHSRMCRYRSDLRPLEQIGRLAVDYFLCERCGTTLQRDGAGAGRRQLWRAA